MAYTEVKVRSGRCSYYRTVSKRRGKKVEKRRMYLGSELKKKELIKKEREADRELGVLESLLTLDQLEAMEAIKKAYSAQPRKNLRNRYEAFCARFTHDSTAIEGNTLTLQETASLLFEDLVPGGRSMREVHEVLDHKKGFDLLLDHDGGLSKNLILILHHLIMENSIGPDLKDQLGVYRKVRVYISGVDWLPPAPEDVPEDMKQLLAWYSRNRSRLHSLVLAVYFHCGFETVHPFVDGNGRVGRLLMNFILHKNGYPMVNIPAGRRFDYYDALERARRDGDLRPFIGLMIGLLKESRLFF